MNRTGRVAVPRNPDIPLRAPGAQRNKWAAQQRRPTNLNNARRHCDRFMATIHVHRLEVLPFHEPNPSLGGRDSVEP